jgi:hypothetical protein
MSSEEAVEDEQAEEADEADEAEEAEEAEDDDEVDNVAPSFLRNRRSSRRMNTRTPSSSSLIGETMNTNSYPLLPNSCDYESSSDEEAPNQEISSEEE